MRVMNVCVMTGLAIGVSFAASAQQNAGAPADVKYCNALARSYQSMWPPQEGMPVGDVVQLGRCDSETSATIAFLEKKLTDKRIDLPAHEGVAQPSGASTSNTR